MKTSLFLAALFSLVSLLLSYPVFAESDGASFNGGRPVAVESDLDELLDLMEFSIDEAVQDKEENDTTECVNECNRRHKDDLRLCRVGFQLAKTACQKKVSSCLDGCPLIDLFGNCRTTCHQNNLNCIAIAGGRLMNCGKNAQTALGDCLVNECGFHRIPVDINTRTVSK